MKKIYQFLFFLFYIYYIGAINKKDILNNEVNDSENNNKYFIHLQEVQIKYLKYNQNNEFKVDNTDNAENDIFVNFLSINCGIKIKINNNRITLLNQADDSYSFLIDKETSLNDIIFQVEPLMDIIDGNYKYNYDARNCPLIINSGEHNKNNKENKIKMENNEITFFYFNEYLTEYNILYNLNNSDIDNDKFVTFYFLFNKKSQFEINISDEYTSNIINTSVIENSTNIFLDHNKLKNINRNLVISIKSIDNKNPILLKFKPIRKNCTSILHKNYLNYGFITSNTSYQHYYMEIFKGEEGEIILHSKRTNGKLYGLIIPKNNNDNLDIKNDINRYYPFNKERVLEYNENTFKLKYNFSNTNICEEGCYLLITYFHENFEHKFIVGYEFTLLVKAWDDIDLKPKIINIPFNEYIFGYFEKDSTNEHFYSIFIPEDAKEIIIQIEGKYFEGFIGAGKKKLITTRKIDSIKKMEITNEQMVLKYQINNLSDINIKCNDYISFSFRPIDYFMDIFSYYYFRIFYLRENEELIYPLDSNIGNICQPTYNESDSKYFCYFFLKNKNNILTLSYSISNSNQNEDINIYYLKKYDNTYHRPYNLSFRKIQNFFFDQETYVEFVIFKFEFNENKTQKIMLTCLDSKKEIYPNIYSSQIYQLNGINNFNKNKTFKFSLPKTFSFIFTHIYGVGSLDFKDKNISEVFLSSNLKEKPFFYSLSYINEVEMKTDNNFIFKIKLSNIIQNNKISELFYGESMNEILINKQFPFFYYIRYDKFIDVNFRLINNDEIITPGFNKTTIFNIEGYILKYKSLEKKLKGEYIELENPTKGYYEPFTKTGILQINKNYTDKDLYLLIKIEVNIENNEYTNSNILIQTIAMQRDKDDYYILPINQYISGRFNNEEEKYYLIQMSEWDKMFSKDILIEFSPNYKDLDLEILYFENKTFNNENGIKKYRIKEVDENIQINIKNPNNRPNAIYIIRYFITIENDEYKYIFNKNYKIYKLEENSDNTVNFKFEFDNIKIIKQNETVNEKNIYFKISCYLFIEEKTDNNELLDIIGSLSSKTTFSDQIILEYNNNKTFNISFKKISRDYYKYCLLVKIHIIIKDYFLNEDYLVHNIKIDLTKYLEKKNYILFILIGLVAIIIIITVIFCVICNKMRKKNDDLKEKVLSISFSSGMSKDIIQEDKDKNIKKDEDYEKTFI